MLNQVEGQMGVELPLIFGNSTAYAGVGVGGSVCYNED